MTDNKLAASSDNCGHCDNIVSDKGLQCEICNWWFHPNCQDISSDTYKFLSKNTGLHWYCKGCERGALKTKQLLSVISEKQDCLQNEHIKLKEEMRGVKDELATVKEELALLNHKLQNEQITEVIAPK